MTTNALSIPESNATILVNQGLERDLNDKSIEQWRECAEKAEISILLYNHPGYGH